MTNYSDFTQTIAQPDTTDMNQRQKPLTDHYKSTPEAAQITDFAITSSQKNPANSALHSEVILTHNTPYPVGVGVHTALGGDSDYPTPGDILCGALAACLDSTLRIISNKLGVELKSLAVTATAEIDVRGTLRIANDAQVGFHHIKLEVDLRATAGTTKELIQKILEAAEYSCVILQTLRNPPEISFTSSIGTDPH